MGKSQTINTSQVLTQFMQQFIGYGSLSASTWFLGQEEAGVKKIEQLLERLEIWRQLGCKPVLQ